MHEFLTQSLEGDYPPFGENRLTQITAACFNHSPAFRACFLRFLRAKRPDATTGLHATAQVPIPFKGERGQLDLVISRGPRVIAVVENKVDAPLHPNQLKNYDGATSLKSARKVALVRDYFAPKSTVKSWSVLHWRDFYVELRTRIESGKPLTAHDSFIVRNFIEYLEAAHMHSPIRISKAEMKKLAVMLRGIRYAQKTKFKWFSAGSAEFETAANWTRMMEAVFEESVLMPKLKKAAGKNYRFCPSVSHWKDGDENGANTKYPWLGLHWEIWFKKSRGKTRALGVGLFVDETAKWHIEAYRYLLGTDDIDGKPIFDGRGDVTLAKLSEKTLKLWQKWLS